MQHNTFPQNFMRRAIAVVAALVPTVALVALPMQASAMKIVVTDIQGDS
jgi:hypothetical protein